MSGNEMNLPPELQSLEEQLAAMTPNAGDLSPERLLQATPPRPARSGRRSTALAFLAGTLAGAVVAIACMARQDRPAPEIVDRIVYVAVEKSGEEASDAAPAAGGDDVITSVAVGKVEERSDARSVWSPLPRLFTADKSLVAEDRYEDDMIRAGVVYWGRWTPCVWEGDCRPVSSGDRPRARVPSPVPPTRDTYHELMQDALRAQRETSL